MFTALILVCANGIASPETCYFMTNPTFYESYKSCMIDSYQAVTDNDELIELYDEEIQATWKVTKVKCVNWKELEA